MKKSTKILSIILTLVLVLGSVVGTFIFSSFAESSNGNGNSTTLNDISVMNYFGSGKKVVLVGDSFTQGCGSTGVVSYTDKNGNLSIVGNGPDAVEKQTNPDYETGAKLYSLNNRVWYEAIDGNGWAQLLGENLETKFGCDVKNYGMSGVTSGTLVGQTMNFWNSGLVDIRDYITSYVVDAPNGWRLGGIGSNGELVDSSKLEIRTSDYININDYDESIAVFSEDPSVKFRVAYFNENDEFVKFSTWSAGPMLLDKSIGAKALVKVLTSDVANSDKITIATVREENIRVIDGLTEGFDTVFLTIGGNDRGFTDVVDEETGEITMTAEEAFEYNLDWLVNHLVSKNKKVILMSMTPCADDGEMRMSMETIDGIIEDVANANSVPFISVYNEMLDYCDDNNVDINTLRNSDGLHPNDEGYEIVESIIWGRLGLNTEDSNLDTSRKVDFEVTCDKTGYEFTIYKVADLETSTNPYGARYDSLIAGIEDEIFNGDSEGLLAELDKVPADELTQIVGTYSTDDDGANKLFENLSQGIYYVRATDFPANVYAVQNSVFALPYYTAGEGWIYEIDPIPLATKVDESNPEIVKTITNSTKDNVNFTDVSLGDVVEFEIEASRVGSANEVASKDFRLNSYVVSDIMESGLTLNQDSFVVTLEDIDGNIIATLDDTTDYVVNIVANEGVDTTFTVSLTPEYLQETEFYTSANVVIAYSAVLNEYSTREFDGNYNNATNLTYSNKTDVSATVEGNTVYAYTFGIEVNKYDDAGTPLAGSEFALYLTQDDAKAMSNAVATGTSDADGKVEFFTANEDVIRLASGTYYIVETKATESYNRYTDVIPVTITVEYGETEVNGTYIESAPENGIQLVEVKNSKVLIPNTGGDGAMYRYLLAAAFLMLAFTFVILKKRNSKKATATN